MYESGGGGGVTDVSTLVDICETVSIQYLLCLHCLFQSVDYVKVADDTALKVKYQAAFTVIIDDSSEWYCGRW